MKEVRGIVKVGHLPWMHREAIRFKRRGESRKRMRIREDEEEDGDGEEEEERSECKHIL